MISSLLEMETTFMTSLMLKMWHMPIFVLSELLHQKGWLQKKHQARFIYVCVCVCRERERELPPSNPIVIYGEDLEKQSYCWGGGVDSKFECIYFLFSNGLYFFAYSGCARTNFDLSNLLHVTILLESLRLKI